MDHLFLMGILAGIIIFALHVTAANSFPKPLAKDEESKYFEEMKKGSKEARNKLIEHNLRLVAHIIKKYYSNSSEQDDLISIGTIGLIKAISSFDYEKGTRFATYGARCIENEILMYFRNKKKYAQDVSFYEPIDSDKDGNVISIMDTIADDKSVTEEIEDKICAENLYKIIEKELPLREQQIINLRYGLKGRKAFTQREVAKKLGISRSYVSRIEKKALDTLKDKIHV